MYVCLIISRILASFNWLFSVLFNNNIAPSMFIACCHYGLQLEPLREFTGSFGEYRLDQH